MPRSRSLLVPALLFAALLPARMEAQADTARVDVYRFVLDVDVPESPALLALDAAPLRVPRASAPKPAAVSVLDERGRGGAARGVAVDLAPYWLAGGGLRTLPAARDMSVGGRLMRVLTKTLVSLAAVEDADDPGDLRVGLGVRSTLHDPHDVIGHTRLPEEVAAALGAPGEAEEDAELRPLYAAARRRVRARCCLQVAAGWGVEGRLRGAALDADSLRRVRHTLWLAGQLTLGERFDVLATVQGRGVFHPDAALRAGAAVQRKGTAVDVFGELVFDTRDRRLHPGIGAEVRPLDRVGVVAALASDPPRAGREGPATLRFRTLLRWYLARPG